MSLGSPTVDDLINKTAIFMARHFGGSSLPIAPLWSVPWTLSGSLPNHDKQGCYALCNGVLVLYVGVGAGKGPPMYQGHGLGGRTRKYYKMVTRASKTKNGVAIYQAAIPWDTYGLNEIRTIGFDSAYAYISYALEAYLISRLNPPKNSKKPGAQVIQIQSSEPLTPT